jgi:hypothetical protein
MICFCDGCKKQVGYNQFTILYTTLEARKYDLDDGRLGYYYLCNKCKSERLKTTKNTKPNVVETKCGCEK